MFSTTVKLIIAIDDISLKADILLLLTLVASILWTTVIKVSTYSEISVLCDVCLTFHGTCRKRFDSTTRSSRFRSFRSFGFQQAEE